MTWTEHPFWTSGDKQQCERDVDAIMVRIRIVQYTYCTVFWQYTYAFAARHGKAFVNVFPSTSAEAHEDASLVADTARSDAGATLASATRSRFGARVRKSHRKRAREETRNGGVLPSVARGAGAHCRRARADSHARAHATPDAPHARAAPPRRRGRHRLGAVRRRRAETRERRPSRGRQGVLARRHRLHRVRRARPLPRPRRRRRRRAARRRRLLRVGAARVSRRRGSEADAVPRAGVVRAPGAARLAVQPGEAEARARSSFGFSPLRASFFPRRAP